MKSSSQDGTRVVISGIGPVTPRAVSRESLERLFERGNEGPGPIAPVLPTLAPSTPSASLRQIDALGRLAVDATGLAWADARLDLRDEALEEVGVAFGSAYGCLESNAAYLEGIGRRGSRYGNPVVFQNTVPNAATGYASLVSGIRGPTATFSSGVVAGLEAVDFAVGQIREGGVHTAVAGGADRLCPPILALHVRRGDLSPSGVCRPFDRRRDGTVLSDGACALVLEEMHRARARGASPYAEILASAQANHFGQPPGEALGESIREALETAGIRSHEVDVVFSGANGSIGDVWESRGLWDSLGEHAGRIPVTCPKSHMGDTQASAGVLAVALAAMSLASGRIPKTANYREKDPECGLRIHAEEAGSPESSPPSVALVCALGPDGSASTAVLRRCSA